MISRLEVYDTLVRHGELTFRELCVEFNAFSAEEIGDVRRSLSLACRIGECDLVGSTILYPSLVAFRRVTNDDGTESATFL